MAFVEQLDGERELVQQGFGAIQRRDFAGAETAFNRAFGVYQSREALYGLGLIALERNERKLAQQRFAELVDADPKHANACFYLGEICRLESDLDGARKWFERAQSIQPDHKGAHTRLGQLSALDGSPKAIAPDTPNGAIPRSAAVPANAAVPSDAATPPVSRRGIYDIVASDRSPVAADLKRALDELEIERTPSKISWLCHPEHRLTVAQVGKIGAERSGSGHLQACPAILRALPWMLLILDVAFSVLWLLGASTNTGEEGLQSFLTTLDNALPPVAKAAAILIPLGYFGFRIGRVCLQASMCRMALRNGQINVIYGILRKGQLTEELYQVRDLYFERNRLDRLFNQGTLALVCDRPGNRTETIYLTGFYPGSQLPEIVQKYRNVCQKLRAGANYYGRGLIQ